MTGKTAKSGKLILFSLALFLSAALLFALQPMLGKMLLPLAGGTPSGWIVAMAFFQLMLLAGYFLAHLLARFTPRAQGLLHLLCLGAGCFFLPVVLKGNAGPSPGALEVSLLLAAAAAVPFIALSATSATLQRLFTTTGHAAAGDPYFLYAAGNAGSFTGLLLYPFLIERNSALTAQSRGWLLGYLLLIGAAALCLLASGKESRALRAQAPGRPYAPPGGKKRLEWLCLALFPSGILLGVTAHITTDVFSAPMLWVLPLGVYLLTFVVAFSRKPLISYALLLKAQPAAVSTALALTFLAAGALALSWYALLLHLAAFGTVALMCHLRLARVRPLDEPGQLTDFYLMIAAGGALGGVLSAFIAPLLFNTLAEYPLLMLASVLLNEDLRSKVTRRYAPAFLAGLVLLGVFAALNAFAAPAGLVNGFLLTSAFALLTLHPKASLAGGILLFASAGYNGLARPDVLTARNFFGVIKVFDRTEPFGGAKAVTFRYMQHGSTLHGSQMLGAAYETTPTAYYTREGPLGEVISLLKPKSVAVVGLGAGTINCFAAPGRELSFFELDPAVVRMAEEKFTYLSKCGPAPRIVTGDARLQLQREVRKFDLLILDAFSSDTVPAHLLTREAGEIYLRRLAPGGVLLFHITNRHFHLETPLIALGEALGLKSFLVMRASPPQPYAKPSRWLALASPGADLRPLAAKGWGQARLLEKTGPWTDERTDLLSALEF
ncbi:MAG: fused MFS/spermidine synthase [Elusimicrobia bacterium]|nr:fused MFS/spermidine synthase [Elusimicrobiota bacterium]